MEKSKKELKLEHKIFKKKKLTGTFFIFEYYEDVIKDVQENETIRNYIDHEKLPVKLIGGGRDKDYGYLGFSHWAEEDKQIMKVFKNIKTIHPRSIELMNKDFDWILDKETPVYMNLKR